MTAPARGCARAPRMPCEPLQSVTQMKVSDDRPSRLSAGGYQIVGDERRHDVAGFQVSTATLVLVGHDRFTFRLLGDGFTRGAGHGVAAAADDTR